MKIRADIAALVREGHTDTHIAHQLGCHRDTVHRVRRALRLPAAQQLSLLYREALPTGEVHEYKPRRTEISPHRAAANLAALAEAIRPTSRKEAA